MSQIPMPTAIELQQMLSMMYGPDLKAREGEPVPPASGQSLVALYVDDDDQPIAACAVDYPFTAYAGASLTRVPKGTADESIETGEFSQMMIGNVHEIMNICSRLLMNSESPHLRLDGLYQDPDELPEAAQEKLEEPADATHFKVNIPDYGDGGVSFYSLAA